MESSLNIMELPNTPPPALCLQTVLQEDLPVSELPVTIQEDIQIFTCGYFERKSLNSYGVLNSPGCLSFPNSITALTIKKVQHCFNFSFKMWNSNLYWSILLSGNSGPGWWRKGWVEGPGVIRSLSCHEYSTNKETRSQRIVFTKNGVHGTSRVEKKYSNGRVEFLHQEAVFERN
jgi:hypothetical protein